MRQQSTTTTAPAAPRAKRPRRTGAAAVELAIVLPFFMLLLTGMMQFGWVFLVRHSMLHAAREGARAYAVQDASAAAAEQRARDVFGTFGYAPDDFQFSSNAAGDDRTVVISVPMSSPQVSIVDPFNLLGGGTLTAQVTMQQEGTF